MSDIRFTIAGIIVIFAAFLVLGVFGHHFQYAYIEKTELGTCFEYLEDKEPVEVACLVKVLEQAIFFGLILSFIGFGIFLLIKGVRGDWDNKVSPDDMVGPGGTKPKKN